jgi:hypothetical protein
MTRKPTIATRAADFFALFGAARALANATEEHRAPRARDLDTLGIDKADFARIGR